MSSIGEIANSASTYFGAITSSATPPHRAPMIPPTDRLSQQNDYKLLDPNSESFLASYTIIASAITSHNAPTISLSTRQRLAVHISETARMLK